MNTISNRDFEDNVEAAKLAAKSGPVFITDQGEIAYVLLRFDEYQSIKGKQQTVAEMFRDLPETRGCELDLTRDLISRGRAADLDDD